LGKFAGAGTPARPPDEPDRDRGEGHCNESNKQTERPCWISTTKRLRGLLHSAVILIPGCGNSARPDPWRGLWVTMAPTPTLPEPFWLVSATKFTRVLEPALFMESITESAGNNRHEAENEKFLRERTSDPLGPEVPAVRFSPAKAVFYIFTTNKSWHGRPGGNRDERSQVSAFAISPSRVTMPLTYTI